ncbi:MAG: HDOD domain-containing protein [Spartobacteria bacterium]|nr:HDOD domain-containing protein [Spartobacteria bacterium]
MSIEPQKLILNIRRLPAIPHLVADTLRVVSDPRASSQEVEWVVIRDQALTACVLKVVNSAAYGFSRRIESVREAVVLMGMRKMKQVVGAMTASDLFKADISGLVDPRQLWMHALSASLWARQIIERKQLWGCESATTASLLHDLGLLILMQFAGDRYLPVLEEARAQNLHPVVLERKRLGTTHASVGGMLCAAWKLPIAIGQLVKEHHATTTPSDPAIGIVMLANHLAHESGLGSFAWAPGPDIPVGTIDLLELSGKDFEHLNNQRETLNEQVEAFQDALQ